MNENMIRGITISTFVLFSVIIILNPSNTYAEKVDIKSFSLEETVIIETTNNSNEKISSFRIWLSNDNNFKSFKTENGWIGEKSPQGVIIFKSSNSLNPEESVKFGIKTEKISSGVNWKAFNKDGKQIGIGKVLSKVIPQVTTNPLINQSSGKGIIEKSVFKIIPEKPNPGSAIRVTGEGFGGFDEFEFFINEKKIGSFVTNDIGSFVTTMKIPEEQKSDRVDFKIKDKKGMESKISIRLGEVENKNKQLDNIRLTINDFPNILYRGNVLEFSGTASPGNPITLKISDPNGKIINNKIAEVNNKGKWEIKEPIIMKADTLFGKYSVIVSDGKEKILKNWNVESNKKINIKSNYLKFEQGDLMKFNGTALPNKSIEVTIENPLKKEIFSEIFPVNELGYVEFEFQTLKTSMKGTYTIIISQEKYTELVFTGLGELPTIPIRVEFDKLNYKSSEMANILLTGKASEIINLLIIDPSDKPIGESSSIMLQPDGRKTYELDLTNYSSGVYTAVISKGSYQSTKVFTVGLQTGSGEIKINTTKTKYLPGESILILGKTAENSLLTLSLIDLEGNTVKEKEVFSNKDGNISEDSLRIPNNAGKGIWTINVKSGSNFNNITIEVLAKVSEGMTIIIGEGNEIPSVGKIITFKITGVKQAAEIEIKTENGVLVDKLSFPASDQGEINLPWLIPKNIEDGTYIVIVKDSQNTIQQTFEIK